MPGTPATTPIHGAPRIASTDTFDIARDHNAAVDRFDLTALRWDRGLAADRPTTGVNDGWYYATDARQWSRYRTGVGWEEPVPANHAARHQDGGADALTVREAMMATGTNGLLKGLFSAYRNAAQSLANGGIVVFDTEEDDISGWYDPTTGRYTPQIAGWYRLSWLVRPSAVLAADTIWNAYLRKNALTHVYPSPHFQRASGASAVLSAGGTALVKANGTTDYFDVAVEHSVGAAQALAVGNRFSTRFEGHLLGRS